MCVPCSSDRVCSLVVAATAAFVVVVPIRWLAGWLARSRVFITARLTLPVARAFPFLGQDATRATFTHRDFFSIFSYAYGILSRSSTRNSDTRCAEFRQLRMGLNEKIKMKFIGQFVSVLQRAVKWRTIGVG